MDIQVRTRHIKATGFTLVEMLVAIVVGLLLLIGIHKILVAGIGTQGVTSSQADVDRRAQVAMDDITFMLRQASPSTLFNTKAILADYDPARPDMITFAGPPGDDAEPPIDPATQRVIAYQYRLESGKLWRKRSVPGHTFEDVPVVTGVTALSFEFYRIDQNGQPVPTQLARDTVGVDLSITLRDGNITSTLRSSAKLRNA